MNTRLQELLDKQEVCTLDKDEMWELEELLNEDEDDDDTITYDVDDYGVLRVYRGNTILFEAQDFKGKTENEIENFIDEELENE